MPTISNTPRPGYAYDSAGDVWYPIGTGPHTHSDYITQSTAINPAIVDAKGDIIAATAADSVARLAVGANDTVLTADSSTATGLKWATPAAGGMTLLSTTTLSGTSTTVSSINQTYKSLKILINNVNPSSDALFRVRLNNEIDKVNYATLDGQTASLTAGAFDFQITSNNGVDGGSTSTDLSLTVDDYASSTDFKPFLMYGAYNGVDGTIYPLNQGGIFRSNTAITSIVFITNGVATFNGGTVRIYGVN